MDDRLLMFSSFLLFFKVLRHDFLIFSNFIHDLADAEAVSLVTVDLLLIVIVLFAILGIFLGLLFSLSDFLGHSLGVVLMSLHFREGSRVHGVGQEVRVRIREEVTKVRCIRHVIVVNFLRFYGGMLRHVVVILVIDLIKIKRLRIAVIVITVVLSAI